LEAASLAADCCFVIHITCLLDVVWPTGSRRPAS